MRDQLKIQELMDTCLDSRDKELCQLGAQLQEDGAKLAALSLQLQEVISGVDEQSRVVERDLEEINGCFDHHRGKINRIKEREKEARGLIVGAAHEAEEFKICLDRMEDNVCKCGCTPSEVGEEFVSLEECHCPTRHAIIRSPSPYLEPLTLPPDLLSLMVNKPYL